MTDECLVTCFEFGASQGFALWPSTITPPRSRLARSKPLELLERVERLEQLEPLEPEPLEHLEATSFNDLTEA
jgi:hypothetical protein